MSLPFGLQRGDPRSTALQMEREFKNLLLAFSNSFILFYHSLFISLLFLSNTTETDASGAVHAVGEQKHCVLFEVRAGCFPLPELVRAIRERLVPVRAIRVPPRCAPEYCPRVVLSVLA